MNIESNENNKELKDKTQGGTLLIVVKLIFGYVLLTLLWIIFLPAAVGLILNSIFEPTLLNIGIAAIMILVLFKFVPWRKFDLGFKEFKEQIKRNL